MLSSNFIAGIACLMLGAVVMYNNAREPRNKLTRQALLHPSLSAWRRLYYLHGEDASFVNLTGFTKDAFKQLLRLVFPTHDKGINKRGRRQLLAPRDKLGLYLMYLNSRMDNKHLCLSEWGMRALQGSFTHLQGWRQGSPAIRARDATSSTVCSCVIA